MRQIVQELKTGETRLEEVPAPGGRPGHVLIQTTRSLVSLGTERILIRRLPQYDLPDLRGRRRLTQMYVNK